MKSTKYNILVRMMCESKAEYIYNFEIYMANGKKLKEIFAGYDSKLECLASSLPR